MVQRAAVAPFDVVDVRLSVHVTVDHRVGCSVSSTKHKILSKSRISESSTLSDRHDNRSNNRSSPIWTARLITADSSAAILSNFRRLHGMVIVVAMMYFLFQQQKPTIPPRSLGRNSRLWLTPIVIYLRPYLIGSPSLAFVSDGFLPSLFI